MAHGSPRTSAAAGHLTDRDRLRRHLLGIYERLYSVYGRQHWWPGDGPFEVIVGAVLTQSAAWTNVEKALANLKAAGVLSPRGLLEVDERELAELIRPSGYFNAKARKLKAFAQMLLDETAGDLDALLTLPADDLRSLLLSTHGIGPETADSIVLYAAGRPSFVIDSYTRRLFSRLGVVPPSPDVMLSRGGAANPVPSPPKGPAGRKTMHLTPATQNYESWRRLFMDHLPADLALFNEYHALIVEHGKRFCRPAPLCRACPLRDICPAGQAGVNLP